MKRLVLCSGLAVCVVMLMSGLGAAEEGACSMCQAGQAGMMGEPEHEGMRSMRSMMERMMGHMAGGRDAHRDMSLSELKDELRLSPEQVEALKPIETDYRKATIQKTAAIRVAEVELGALLDTKTPDVNVLKQKIKEIGDLQADLMLYRVGSLLKLRKVLSEEQHEKFKSLLRQRMEGFRPGGPMHGMGGSMMP